MAFGPAIILVAAFQIYFPQWAKIVQSWFFWWVNIHLKF
jgi:hypothetical protein